MGVLNVFHLIKNGLCERSMGKNDDGEIHLVRTV